MIMIGSAIFYGIESARYSYVDSIFSITSAMTTTGLMVIDVTRLTSGSQALLFVYMWIGGFVWNR
jgi:Trk-type K+ transport system membrane component